MRVVIINLGGNQGKTTLASHLFYPRMADSKILAVESINGTSADLGVKVVTKVKGAEFKKVYEELVTSENLIVDVGASNVEGFLAGLSSFEDGHDEVDYFAIPLTSGSKEQKEGLNTAALLAKMGVPRDKIRVVFNRVSSDVKDEFSTTFSYADRTKQFIANPACVVFENDIYHDLEELRMTLAEAIDIGQNGQEDLKERLRSASEDARERSRLMKKLSAAKKALKTSKLLDSAFEQFISQP